MFIRGLRLLNFGSAVFATSFVHRSFISSSMANMEWKTATSIYDFTVKDIKGNDVSMEKYKGHVLLIVNVASECGLTASNYKELVELNEQFKESKGLRILAFPCNQFGGQVDNYQKELSTASNYKELVELNEQFKESKGLRILAFPCNQFGGQVDNYQKELSTASNYKELVELNEQFKESKGLRILAFPCNQFGGQEPGTPEEIMCFMKNKKAEFETFEKVDVNGDNAHPLWNFLKHQKGGTFGEGIKWNFTKFIIDKSGNVVERHGPLTKPSKLIRSLEKYF